MRELPLTFIGRGEVKKFQFSQLLKTDRWYIYRVDTPFSTHHFEVFQRKENEWYNCVSYPRSESFSKWAWTYWTYEDCLAKMKEYENN